MRTITCVSAIVLALVATGSQSAGAMKHEAQAWLEPEASLLARMLDDLKVGTVADIGAGRGEFTAFVARHLTSTVVFIATELPAQVPILSKELESRGAANVKVVEGAPTETKLPDGSCDALFLRTTYHHFSHPVEMTESLFRTLRRGGTLFIIEQPRVRMDTGEWDGIMQPVLIEQLQKAGFVHERTVDPFGRPLYLVVMRKP